jgi:hypothetical protein
VISPWPDLIVGIGIFAINLDASRQVYVAVRRAAGRIRAQIQQIWRRKPIGGRLIEKVKKQQRIRAFAGS